MNEEIENYGRDIISYMLETCFIKKHEISRCILSHHEELSLGDKRLT